MMKMKKKKEQQKIGWATAHFNMGNVSQYRHCIMTWWAGRLLGLVMSVSQYNHCIVTGAAVARE